MTSRSHVVERTGEPDSGTTPRGSAQPRRITVLSLQIAIIVVVLVAWQYVPDIPGIAKLIPAAATFFISSPSLIAKELWTLGFGHDGGAIWNALVRTVLTTLVGTFVACVVGAVGGLAISNWAMLRMVTQPFVVSLNAVPRIALVPVVVLIMGASAATDALTAFSVVFFLIFYSAFGGASSVPPEVIQNARLLGATSLRVMWQVRWPYALEWTMVSIPNAIAFGLIGTVTAEFLTGSGGLGYQLVLALNNTNATLLFSIVFVLAVVGVILVRGSAWLQERLLPWRVREDEGS
jgi:NitT/TauT family transport system permease protein